MEDQLRELQEELARVKSLIEHPGWKWLLEIAKSQEENRLPAILQKCNSLFENREFEKGEISGIKVFTKLPYTYLNELEADIEQLEEETEDGNTRSKYGGGDEFGAEFEPPV